MPSNTLYNPMSVNDFEKNKISLNIIGIDGNFTGNSISNIDLLLTDDVLVTGASVICKNHVFGDAISLQVVDTNNILGYGANTVLNTFANNWIVSDDSQKQIDFVSPYPAKIIAGLTLRVSYTSIGTNNGQIAVNYILHKVLV